ncbi:hypothetical protein GcC1_058045 [Golovinomyces cichoracearum]|uniref:Uncharacterized protein n=1 Tax=Golovinomyces cichoracearum TaxID=62708 RepID=A0A420IU63_9PEZI|nr:hypothetical protein GcC1_058045 [Golovinomyces cichoracearum]
MHQNRHKDDGNFKCISPCAGMEKDRPQTENSTSVTFVRDEESGGGGQVSKTKGGSVERGRL